MMSLATSPANLLSSRALPHYVSESWRDGALVRVTYHTAGRLESLPEPMAGKSVDSKE
jgi:hypothetical protein